MNIKHFTLFLLTGLMLSGCNKQIPSASCSSPETQKLLATLLTRQAKKLTVAKRDDLYEASTLFGAVKVNTLLAQLQIAVANVKRSKKTPIAGRASVPAYCKLRCQRPSLPTLIMCEMPYANPQLRSSQAS
jgi:hypothetical protein